MKPIAPRVSFVPDLLHLALPIALQTLMMTSLNLADTFMVGQLGEVQIGAIALGNQIFFLLMLFQFGVGSGGAVFASQFWGRRDVAGVRRSLGLSLLFGVAGAILFTVAAVGMPALIMSIFTNDQQVIDEGVAYLRVVAASYVFTAVSLAYTHALRSVGDTRLPMYATGISITLNIAGNYVLIFGKLGLPAMGVAGAGLSTAIARFLEMAIILVVVYRRRGPVAASVAELVDWSRDFVKRFVGRAGPVVMNEILWSTGFTMYTVVFGRMGTSYLAAYNISDTVGRLLLVVFISTAQATAVVIGNEIGAGREPEARRMGHAIMRLVPFVSAAVGVIGFFVVAPLVPYLFEVSDAVRVLVRQFLRLFSVLMVVKTINLHVIVGILRGGGDTRYALAIDIVPLWVIGVPAAMITGLVLGLPAPVVYLALNFEELTRLVVGWRRVSSDAWIHDLTTPAFEPLPGLEAAGAPEVIGGGATSRGIEKCVADSPITPDATKD
ncbi:MAG: MATE family efflux transporter [Alkalispirochaeta sp.]